MQKYSIVTALLVVATILVGGYTRLKHAGLSIVEWKPIVGIIPPLSSNKWAIEFDKYKNSPEYNEINFDINLEEFKIIYYIEYFHRILGRLVGISFILPFIILSILKKLSKKEIYFGIMISFLICLQGFIGWIMVKSGLDKDPFVDHFKLAIHLTCAFIIYSILYVYIKNNNKNNNINLIVNSNNNLNNKIINFFHSKNMMLLSLSVNICIFILFLQIFLGGLVAGLDAGLIHNTFPRMSGRFIPTEIVKMKINFSSFYNPVFVQFIHRLFAYMLSSIITFISFIGLFTKYKDIKKAALYLLFALVIQMFLGIITILSMVYMPYAIMHQFGAIFLLSMLLNMKLKINSKLNI